MKLGKGDADKLFDISVGLKDGMLLRIQRLESAVNKQVAVDELYKKDYPKNMATQKFNESTPEIVRIGLERRTIYTSNLMTVVVDFSDGPWEEAEPFHAHPHEQTSYVAEGKIIFYCEGEPEQHLQAGDMFSAKSNQKHTICLLTPTARLIDSFNPIR